jgi:hypothetical protein
MWTSCINAQLLNGSCKVGEEIIASLASMPCMTNVVSLWLVIEFGSLDYLKIECSQRRQANCIQLQKFE